MSCLAPSADYVNWSNVAVLPEAQRRLELARGHRAQRPVTVYEGFGSFHSENVEDLMALDDAHYTPPANLPVFAQKILSKRELAQLSGKAVQSAGPLPKHSPCKRVRDEPESVATPTEHGSALCTSESMDGATPCEQASGVLEGEGEDDDSGDSYRLLQSIPETSLLAELCLTPVGQCAMGKSFLEQYFSITPRMTFTNHGAFGSTLTGAMAIKHMYERLMEQEVVAFMDRQLLPLIVYSIRSLSSLLRADPRQVVLVQNATFGLNCAMQLITKDDVVGFLDTEYLSVYKMMWFRCQEVGAVHHELTIAHLLHNDAVMGDDAALTEEVCRQLPEGCTTFIMDYVTSTSALQLPVFTHLIPALRRRGVRKIIVDGAHAPLQIDLNFAALPPESQPTVFVGNLHKWFSAPKAVGFLWVRAGEEEGLHSVVLSHGAGDGLLSEFIWDGTRDYGAYLSIPAVVNFWRAQDCDRVRRHCGALLRSAVSMLTAAFNSRRVARHAPFMSLVELPAGLQDSFVTAKYIQDVLHDVYSIEVPVKRINDRYYLRVSAFVYNTPEDYVYLREAVLTIASTWIASEERRALALAHAAKGSGGNGEAGKEPCDERIRRQGGCGVSGLDPTLKRKKTAKFA